MKRKTLRFMACAAVMALTLSVTACGDGDGSANSEIVQAEQDEEIEAEVKAEEIKAETQEEAKEAEAAAEEAAKEVEAEAEEAETEAEENAAEFSTLEDYYNAPGMKEQMDSMAESMSEEGMSAAVEVKGNEFIMIIQYEDSSMIVDGMGEAIDQMMEAFADTFVQTAAEFDKEIGQDGACTVTVRYLDPDGNVLSENSYKAN